MSDRVNVPVLKCIASLLGIKNKGTRTELVTRINSQCGQSSNGKRINKDVLKCIASLLGIDNTGLRAELVSRLNSKCKHFKSSHKSPPPTKEKESKQVQPRKKQRKQNFKCTLIVEITSNEKRNITKFLIPKEMKTFYNKMTTSLRNFFKSFKLNILQVKDITLMKRIEAVDSDFNGLEVYKIEVIGTGLVKNIKNLKNEFRDEEKKGNPRMNNIPPFYLSLAGPSAVVANARYRVSFDINPIQLKCIKVN